MSKGVTIVDPSWTAVQIRCPDYNSNKGIKDWLDKRIEWLTDEARPGFHSARWLDGKGVEDVLVFYISDPGTAFEFKVRWG